MSRLKKKSGCVGTGLLPLDTPYPGRPFRVYFAVTNACNRECPWCSTYSGPSKRTFLSRPDFFRNLPPAGQFEVQFEGGEPLLHPDLFWFAERARETGRCTRVVLSTNGTLLPWRLLGGAGGKLDHRGSAHALGKFVPRFSAPFTMKVSLNHHLYERDPLLFEKARVLSAVFDDLQAVADYELVFNVRRRRGASIGDDAWLLEKIDAFGIGGRSNVFFLQAYGRNKDDPLADPPFLVGHDFKVVNPDGREFGTDLTRRSEAMGELP
ncbi:MAG: radical SAM protein [Promethearchaeota archaeon]